MVELRDYQVKAIADINALWPSARSIILQMATGAGKTITASALLRGSSSPFPTLWSGGWCIRATCGNRQPRL